MTFEVADVLVMSDLHAMSPDVDVGRFKQFVGLNPAKKLVLAGDTLDFYMWRHGRVKIDEAPGIEVLDFLLERARMGVEIVIVPGNHDMDWAWLVDGAAVPKRYVAACYADGMLERMKALVEMPNVSVTNVVMVGGALIVHGHEGWHGDWLWRMSEMGDRATRYRFVGGQWRRSLMGRTPRARGLAVTGHGFYRRLAKWGMKMGVSHVIHGHTHVHGRRMRWGVAIDCLPAWRPSEGPGGGMALRGDEWVRVEVE